MRRLALLLVLSLSACGSERLTQKNEPDPIPEPTCGDGKIDDGEACDGSDLGGRSCSSEGFDFGTLSCTAGCQLATGGCVKLCGNGQLDPGEQCDGTEGPLACAEWGYKQCSSTCTVDAVHCDAVAFESGITVVQSSGGPALLADLAPAGRGDLVTAVPDFARLQTHTWNPTSRSFSEARKISRVDGPQPALPIAADLDGDGHLDLAAINTDGSADRYRYLPGQDRFQTEALTPDGACALGPWVGATPSALLALACPGTMSADSWDAIYLLPGGASPGPLQSIQRTGISSAALADDDGDGLPDLFVATHAGEVEIRRAPSFDPGTPVALGPPATLITAGDFDGDGDADLVAWSGSIRIYENLGATGFAQKREETGVPRAMVARDLDLDGRVDFAWVEEGKLEIRRNLGEFTFAPRTVTTGSGLPLSLSAGDLEGDGDPDLVVTVSPSATGSGTHSFVLVNQVR